MSYGLTCENCGDDMSAACKFCPWCGEEVDR